MTFTVAVCTTFPNNSWDVYAKKMLQSVSQFWPAEIPLMIAIDDDLLLQDIKKISRPQDAVAIGWTPEHKAFVERNKSRDHPDNYRLQVTRFCHKIFALERVLDANKNMKAAGHIPPRYIIWMDADVITEKKVELSDEVVTRAVDPVQVVVAVAHVAVHRELSLLGRAYAFRQFGRCELRMRWLRSRFGKSSLRYFHPRLFLRCLHHAIPSKATDE